MTDPLQLLHNRFGFETFRDGQRDVIDVLIAGRSAAAVFPTGGGKSLCYQLPALLLPHLTLVVSPLIALMKDQIDALEAKGISAARLDSSLSLDDYHAVMDRIDAGSLKLLYVAPERFNNERFRARILNQRISLMAVDEAHCISEWGHNFRPDYLKLAVYAREFGVERVLALTATAPPSVLDDIRAAFAIEHDDAIVRPFYRPNLELRFSAPDDRDKALASTMQDRPRGASVVYVTRQQTSEDVAQSLTGAGLCAKAYHAGMASEQREAIQNWFMTEDQPIVVATIAFGMGIDKSSIRYVYHYNLPKSLENYAQEIGRAGRDGAHSVCEMFLCAEDIGVLENFVYGDTPSRASVAALIDDVFADGHRFERMLGGVASKHDIRLLVLRTLLTYLELDGYLAAEAPFYAGYRFRPLMSSREMFDSLNLDQRRRSFLASVFTHARKARSWFDIDLDETARDMNEPRQRVVTALDFLAEKGCLELKTTRITHRYRVLHCPDDPVALTQSLVDKLARREAGDIDRIHKVLRLAQAKQCQVGVLNTYFGQPLEEPCGHCTHCATGQSPTLIRPEPTVDADSAAAALALAADESGQDLRQPRRLARFLAGVSSPMLVAAKLTRHPLFGSQASVAFPTLLAWARQQLR